MGCPLPIPISSDDLRRWVTENSVICPTCTCCDMARLRCPYAVYVNAFVFVSDDYPDKKWRVL